MSEFWSGRPILITGGTSFIGSHLTDALVAAGAKVRLVDDLSSGRLGNVAGHVDAGAVEFVRGSVLDTAQTAAALDGIDICFHLANRHGGRGYVDRFQADCATNFAADGIVIQAAHRVGAKVVFASSGCVYPLHLQRDPSREVRLSEDMVGPPYDADNTYGYAKLMAELTLKAFHRHYGMRAAIGRFFTVYGERGYESHAVTALIARSFIDQDPYVVWGNGEQRRNWTHVSDIVSGLLLLGEKVDDATSVNLGTTEAIRVIDAVHEILRYTGKAPRIEFHPNKPTGPACRVADRSLATSLLGWTPKVAFADGLRQMIDWYYATKNPDAVRAAMAIEERRAEEAK